jgi:putative ATP-dependent endonuclease of OLD family
MLFARKVMLVEGPAELFLIPALLNQVMNIDLDREGISIIPIYGVHFAVYAKLFAGNALRKKCAIITDGDLEPSDAIPNLAGEDDLPVLPDLKLLENDYVHVFSCVTTFERALVFEGSLEMLAWAADDIGAPNIAKKLRKGIEDLARPGLSEDDRQKILILLRESVLNTAKRFGKARFAQIVARHVGKATRIPKYLVDAVTWLAAP